MYNDVKRKCLVDCVCNPSRSLCLRNTVWYHIGTKPNPHPRGPHRFRNRGVHTACVPGGGQPCGWWPWSYPEWRHRLRMGLGVYKDMRMERTLIFGIHVV